MAIFPFLPQLALDAAGGLAPAGSGQIYAEADTGFTTPLSVTDATGAPMSTVHVTSLGVTEYFQTTDHGTVWWKSGALPPVALVSHKGYADAATAAAVAAQAAQAAAEAVEAFVTETTDEQIAGIVADAGSDTRSALEAIGASFGDDDVAALVGDSGSATRAALEADYVAAMDHLAVLTSETTTSTTFTDLATAGPARTITVPPSGRIRVDLRARMSNSTSTAFSFAGFALSGANTLAASDDNALGGQFVTGSMIQVGTWFVLTGLTPGATTVTMKYRVTAGTGTFARRALMVTTLP